MSLDYISGPLNEDIVFCTQNRRNLWRGSSYAVAKNLSGTISVYIIYYGICNNKLHLESTLLYLINPITIELNWYLDLEREQVVK